MRDRNKLIGLLLAIPALVFIFSTVPVAAPMGLQEKVKGKIESDLGAGVVRIDVGRNDGVKLGLRGRVFYYDDLTRGEIYVADFRVTDIDEEFCIAVITKGYVEQGQQVEWMEPLRPGEPDESVEEVGGDVEEQGGDTDTGEKEEKPDKIPVKKGPTYQEILARANKAFEDGKYEEALQHYETLSKRNPRDTDVLEKLALCNRYIEEERRAEEERLRIEREKAKIPTYKAEAKSAIEREDFGTAFENYRSVLAVAPEDAEAEAGIKEVIGIIFKKGFDAYSKGDYATAKRWFEKGVEENHAGSQYCLGIMYDMGQGVPKDSDRSMRLIQLAAAQGYAMARSHIESLRRSEEMDRAEANTVQALRDAAIGGSVEAQFNLGVLYEKGDGVPRDHKEAISWYRMAAEKGFPRAQNNLAVMYLRGKGVPQNDLIAFKWFHKAAEQGYAEAQNNLGVMYQQGRGVQKNLVSAINWYRRAAEQGDAMAQYNLAFCYHNAQGVGRNIDEAAKWYRLAAEQGHEGARRALRKIGRD